MHIEAESRLQRMGNVNIPVSDGADMAAPLFILAPPRSFTSVVSAMLGQHPEMYGLPELQLFGAETLAEWWSNSSRASFPMSHGLLRAVAEIYFGDQSTSSIQLARGWVRRRLSFTTGIVFELLATKLYPLVPVEKSPSTVYRLEFLNRLFAMFPQARFLHLFRHPRGQGLSVLKAISEAQKVGPIPRWLLQLASFPRFDGVEASDVDPQRGWYTLNKNICDFLLTVPQVQKLGISGEHLLTDPDEVLPKIVRWLHLREDKESVEAMKHPENSVFSRLGPPEAQLGNDYYFLENPRLRREKARVYNLDEPLEWSNDGRSFTAEVKTLARQFGYA